MGSRAINKGYAFSLKWHLFFKVPIPRVVSILVLNSERQTRKKKKATKSETYDF